MEPQLDQGGAKSFPEQSAVTGPDSYRMAIDTIAAGLSAIRKSLEILTRYSGEFVSLSRRSAEYPHTHDGVRGGGGEAITDAEIT